MKLVSQIKLLPDIDQTEALRATVRTANAACNFVSEQAWRTKTFRQYDLHHLCYKEIRTRFGLSAQVAVRVTSKVSDSYKRDNKTIRKFKLNRAITFDDRILSWRLKDSTVSIWTVFGRTRVHFVTGPKQRVLLQTRKGESDLTYRRGRFYLLASCDVETPAKFAAAGVIGVDLGIKNIAVDSDGVVHSSAAMNNVKHRHRRLRSKLQAKCTRSSRLKLKKLSGKEARFARDVNHRISKELVAKAKDTTQAIAHEDLTGIRLRITVSRQRRATLFSWSFSQLRTFISYKSEREGVPVILVDPWNTSRTCPSCGNVDKRNRKSQHLFSCESCGFAGLADHIAAENIRRAAINQPIVTRVDAEAPTISRN